MRLKEESRPKSQKGLSGRVLAWHPKALGPSQHDCRDHGGHAGGSAVQGHLLSESEASLDYVRCRETSLDYMRT